MRGNLAEHTIQKRGANQGLTVKEKLILENEKWGLPGDERADCAIDLGKLLEKVP